MKEGLCLIQHVSSQATVSSSKCVSWTSSITWVRNAESWPGPDLLPLNPPFNTIPRGFVRSLMFEKHWLLGFTVLGTPSLTSPDGSPTHTLLHKRRWQESPAPPPPSKCLFQKLGQRSSLPLLSSHTFSSPRNCSCLSRGLNYDGGSDKYSSTFHMHGTALVLAPAANGTDISLLGS